MGAELMSVNIGLKKVNKDIDNINEELRLATDKQEIESLKNRLESASRKKETLLKRKTEIEKKEKAEGRYFPESSTPKSSPANTFKKTQWTPKTSKSPYTPAVAPRQKFDPSPKTKSSDRTTSSEPKSLSTEPISAAPLASEPSQNPDMVNARFFRSVLNKADDTSGTHNNPTPRAYNHVDSDDFDDDTSSYVSNDSNNVFGVNPYKTGALRFQDSDEEEESFSKQQNTEQYTAPSAEFKPFVETVDDSSSSNDDDPFLSPNNMRSRYSTETKTTASSNTDPSASAASAERTAGGGEPTPRDDGGEKSTRTVHSILSNEQLPTLKEDEPHGDSNDDAEPVPENTQQQQPPPPPRQAPPPPPPPPPTNQTPDAGSTGSSKKKKKSSSSSRGSRSSASSKRRRSRKNRTSTEGDAVSRGSSDNDYPTTARIDPIADNAIPLTGRSLQQNRQVEPRATAAPSSTDFDPYHPQKNENTPEHEEPLFFTDEKTPADERSRNSSSSAPRLSEFMEYDNKDKTPVPTQGDPMEDDSSYSRTDVLLGGEKGDGYRQNSNYNQDPVQQVPLQTQPPVMPQQQPPPPMMQQPPPPMMQQQRQQQQPPPPMMQQQLPPMMLQQQQQQQQQQPYPQQQQQSYPQQEQPQQTHYQQQQQQQQPPYQQQPESQQPRQPLQQQVPEASTNRRGKANAPVSETQYQSGKEDSVSTLGDPMNSANQHPQYRIPPGPPPTEKKNTASKKSASSSKGKKKKKDKKDKKDKKGKKEKKEKKEPDDAQKENNNGAAAAVGAGVVGAGAAVGVMAAQKNDQGETDYAAYGFERVPSGEEDNVTNYEAQGNPYVEQNYDMNAYPQAYPPGGDPYHQPYEHGQPPAGGDPNYAAAHNYQPGDAYAAPARRAGANNQQPRDPRDSTSYTEMYGDKFESDPEKGFGGFDYATYADSTGERRKTWFLLSCVCCVLVLISLTLGVVIGAIVFAEDGKDRIVTVQSNNITSDAPTRAPFTDIFVPTTPSPTTRPPTAPPSPAPTSLAPTVAPTGAPFEGPLIQDQELYDMIAAASYDNGTAILVDGSPQQSAFRWLQNLDNLRFQNDTTSEDNDQRRLSLSNERIIQRYSLAVFFFSTNGPSTWVRKDNWLGVNISECNWGTDGASGPNCQDNDDVVTALQFVSNDVSGELPPEIGLLTGLRVLLIDNAASFDVIDAPRMSGGLPVELADLVNMDFLKITGHNFSKGLPDFLFSSWGSVTSINLSRNNIPGAIPTQLSTLQTVTSFNLGMNRLEGAIPDTISGLENVLLFNVQENMLSTMPDSISTLANVRAFYADSNDFTGNFPDFSQMSQLRTLDLSNNNFSGELSGDRFPNVPKIRILILRNNSFTGVLPDLTPLADPIKDLYLDGNSFTDGLVPESVCESIIDRRGNGVVDCDSITCGCCGCDVGNTR